MLRRPILSLHLMALGAVAAFGPVAIGPAAAAPPVPEWIWVDNQGDENKPAYFRRTFEVAGTVKSATLVTSCDNHVAAYLNGQLVAKCDEWQQPVKADVAKHLKPGVNVLACQCSNDGGPAALVLRLTIEKSDGMKDVLVTDKSWTASRTAKDGWQAADFAAPWTAAVSIAKLGAQPWGDIGMDGAVVGAPGAAVAGGAATPGERCTVPEGFRVERLYSVPKAVQGSWVSMTNDPKGRLICSDQGGGLYRVTVGENEEATKVEKLEVKIGQAQGLLHAFGDLYVTVNGNAAQGSGVYRVRDTDGDDQYDEVTLLKKLSGGGEHGPHGLRVGPDGVLYVIAGNHTKIPDGLEKTSPLWNWDEDLLLPRNPDGNGHATGVMAPGGWVARFSKDNTNWELFCGGFRNPYDIAFDQHGELFTYDADMEWDTGAPWYRPTRVNHCTSASEFGWRYGTGKWPAYSADSLGAVADIGLGSPTGIEFGTGAKFPAKYQRALYILDWTYGKIYAVHLDPDGAGYSSTFEVFCEAKPLPVTDICVNVDGALYFTVGGRGTQSGLYRVTYTGTEPTAPALPLDNPAAKKARELRRQLESFHRQQDPAAIPLAWPLLNSTDRVLRFAARRAIERQELSLWRDKALAETRTTALIHGLIALVRVAGEAKSSGKNDVAKPDPALQAEVLKRLNQLPYKQLTEEQTLDALRCYGLAFLRLGGRPAEPLVQETLAALDKLFPHDNELVSREACQVLIYLRAPGIVGRSLDRLKQAQTQQDQMHYAFVLRNVAEGWTAEQHREHFSWMSLAESKYRGGASFKKFVQQIRKDTQDKMSEAERTALKDVIEGKESVAVVKLETTRQFVHNWQMPDLQPLLVGVDKGRNFARGRAAFEAAQCFKCHRFKGEGGDTGPDITGVGNRFDARYLLEAMVEPNKVISDQYRSFVIETTEGRIFTGRVLSEDKDRLLLRTDPFAREPVSVPLASIESRAPSKVSEMPAGLINTLTKDEVLDLIAYMRSAGNEQDAAFKP